LAKPTENEKKMFTIALSGCNMGSADANYSNYLHRQSEGLADANVCEFGNEISISRQIPETASSLRTYVQTTT